MSDSSFKEGPGGSNDPGGPNIGDVLKQAQQMQERIGALQRELGMRRFEAASGGGMVTVVVSGQLRVLEVRIEPNLLGDQTDQQMTQDLIAAAVNAALEKAQRGVQEEFARLQGGLRIPGMPGTGGPA